MKNSLIGLAVAATLSVTNATACDYCLISQGISPLLVQNGAGLKVAQRYTRLDNVYEGTDKVDNPGVKEEYWATELSGFYGFSERFLLLVNVPLRKTRGDGELVEGPDGALESEHMTGGATGLGDVSVLGRYTVFTHHTLDSSTLLAGVFGVKLPTGSTNKHSDQGEYLDSHLQLGTGSTDLLLGVSANHVLGRYSFSANVLGAITGEGETGHTKHRFGNSLNYDVTGKYRITPAVVGESSNELFLSLGVNGEYRKREKLDGDTVPDSGGNTIYLAPGIQYLAGTHWVFETAWHYAVYHDLNETQLGENYRLVASATYLF
jgi:hypothetical protein